MPTEILVQTTDGFEFRAENERGIVRQMKATQWNYQGGKRAYMTEVAERVASITGRGPIRTSAKGFLHDLNLVGLITITRREIAAPAPGEPQGSAPAAQPTSPTGD